MVQHILTSSSYGPLRSLWCIRQATVLQTLQNTAGSRVYCQSVEHCTMVTVPNRVAFLLSKQAILCQVVCLLHQVYSNNVVSGLLATSCPVYSWVWVISGYNQIASSSESVKLGHQTVSDFTLRQWYPNTQASTKEISLYIYIYGLLSCASVKQYILFISVH